MKTLILAEKSNQAGAYVSALGNFKQQNGYYENDKYIITWGMGHLVQLETDDKYRQEGNWSKSYLPLIPEKYQYCVEKVGKETNRAKKNQLEIIRQLFHKCDSIINATDGDREGELIFLYIYNFLNCKLPYTKRLWINTLTENDIKKGFANLLPAEQMKNLGKSAYARAITDWLVGVNGTQAATLQLGKGTLLTIGRVQTAILKIICERYIKNTTFKKSFTYKIRAEHPTGNTVFYSDSDVFQTQQEAEQVKNKLCKEHSCKERIEEIKKVGTPLLHSIDSLIIEANKKFGYTSQETLDMAQSLYEKKITSYPRTDTQYINIENFEHIKTFLPQMVKKCFNIDYSFIVDSPKSVNNKKLQGSHDAIVPTGQQFNMNSLSEKEQNVLSLVLHRCMESFSVPAEYQKLKLVFDNNSIEFVTTTSKLLKAGWKNYSLNTYSYDEDVDENEQNIDLPFKKGDRVQVNSFEVKEIESRPPQLYTEGGLTSSLVNIGKFLREENPELLEKLKSDIDLSNVQIGTQATRPAIIERLKKLGFVELKKNKLTPTEKGLAYYNIVKKLEVSNIATTAILEKRLKDLAEEKITESQFYSEIKSYTTKIVEDIFSIEESSPSFVNKDSGICICPKCQKGTIRVGSKAYFCSEYKNGCTFAIWKTVAEKKLSEAIVKELCTKRVTKEIKDFTGKKGKFNAKLKLSDDFKVEFFFDNSNHNTKK